MPIVVAGALVSARAFGLGVAVFCTIPTAAFAADIIKDPDTVQTDHIDWGFRVSLV